MFIHKRFALLAMGYILTIYATSGMMRDLSNLARQLFGDSLSLVVTGVLLFILASIVAAFRQTFTQRQILPLSAVLLGYSFSLWWLTMPEERFHLFQYGFLCVLCYKAVPDRFQGLPRYGLAILVVILAGIGDELIQWLRPNRVGDIRDILINSIAAVLAQCLIVIFQDKGDRLSSAKHREPL